MAIALRYAARSDVGLVRRRNDDSGYAGPHLLVVADGMGGHAGGDVASSLAIGELAPLDGESHGRDALDHLSQAVLAAHRELIGRVGEDPKLAGMGTTVTALLRTGNRLALAHIGDSRAYLLRDGVLAQITKDHTFVQTLVDEGRLTLQEAEQHPQRSVLMRVLSDVVDDVQPDLSMREARVGDRYLLCSDGLSGVVSPETLQETLAAGADPGPTCESLVQLALRGGAPDNVTCIVADVVDEATLADVAPSVVGAASTHQPRRPASDQGSAAERAAALTAPDGDGPEVSSAGDSGRPRLARRIVGGLVVGAVLVVGAYAAWQWIGRQYYVGAHDGSVAVFRGLRQDVGPLSLASVDKVASDVPVADLPEYQQELVQSGIVADTEDKALAVIQNLREVVQACRGGTATSTPGPSGSPSLSPSTGPGGSPAGTAPGTLSAGAPSAGAISTPEPTGSPVTGAGRPVRGTGTVGSATSTGFASVTPTLTPGSSPTPSASDMLPSPAPSPAPQDCGTPAP